MQEAQWVSMPETLNGLIERVTYHNPENGFAVLKVKVKARQDLVTVVGSTTSVTAAWVRRAGDPSQPYNGATTRRSNSGSSPVFHIGDHEMNEKYRLSRRSSLKSLGVMGTVTLFSGARGTTLLSAEVKADKGPESKQVVDKVDLAVTRFGKGHSCAQAVFSAFAEQMGMDCQTAVKLTSGFGGGMGLGSVCGAVTGSFMAIGLKFGGIEPKAKEQTSKLAREFAERFKAQHGSLNCRDLLGCDLSTPEGRQKAREKNVHSTICTGIVRDAAKILNGLLTEQRRDSGKA